MNIDYAAIITAADKRKSALKQLEDLVNQAGPHEEALRGALHYVTDLQAAWSQLDKEGRELLPKELSGALAYIGTTRSRLAEAIRNSSEPAAQGLEVVAKHSEGA